ncbi:hypothetical protein ANTRET_LOCUS9656 [Anthophora retusa]
MSGEIQARKRKEKKRRKDEEDTVIPPSATGNITENLSDNITIHVSKETGSGEHWCARIIFFVLLALLVGAIGIVIFEHRGTTDINTPLKSSRWAFIFDGWVDDSLLLSDEESHGVETEETEETEAHEETEETEKDEEDENMKLETVESREAEETEEIESEEQEEERIVEEESHEEETELFQSEEETTDGNEEEDTKETEDELIDEDISQQNDIEVLEEIYGVSKERTSNEKDIFDESGEQYDEMLQMPSNEEIYEKFLNIPGVNEVNDNVEPLEEVESIEQEEYVNDVDVKPEIEETEEESASVAMKFGVGVALIVAAHFVLVKRWNNEVIFVQNQSKLIPTEKETTREKVDLKKEEISKTGKAERKEDKKEEMVDEEEEMRNLEWNEIKMKKKKKRMKKKNTKRKK